MPIFRISFGFSLVFIFLLPAYAQPVCNTYWFGNYTDQNRGSIFGVFKGVGYSPEEACEAEYNRFLPNVSTSYPNYPDADRVMTPSSWVIDLEMDDVTRVILPFCKIYGTYFYPNNPRLNGLPPVKIFSETIKTCYEPRNVHQISLIGLTETRPAGTGGTSTITFTAKTTTPNGQPKAGVALNFSVDVKPNSGGHEHAHDATRKKGTMSPPQGVTNANGELVVTFKAEEAAGIHTIKATCPSCSNKEASKEIQVKVPGLIELGADTATPPQYTLVGAIPGKHTSNHWFTPKARDTLLYVVNYMTETGWGKVGVNDGSLIWGGLFDVKEPWKTPHSEHRRGTEVDIAFKQPKAITEIQKKKTYSQLCKKDNAALGVQTLWHEEDLFPDHFHVYLTGQGLTSKAGGGLCCMQYVKWEPDLNKDKTPVIGKDGKPKLKAVSYCEETTPR